MKLRYFLSLVLAIIFAGNAMAYDVIVAKDGSGTYTTVQAAIDNAPANLTVPYTIFIKNGKYFEKINIPSNKPFLQMTGESVGNVILTYNDYAGRMLTCNSTVGTQNSASFTVGASDFVAINITFVNSFGDGSQAVTLLVNADRAVFKNCRFLGNQDTIYLKGTGAPRDYFKNCYIDGNVDFIFGSAIAVFDSCVVYAKSRTAAGASFITAPNTPSGQNYGLVFRDTRLPNNTGATSYYLSRPWPSPDVPSTRQKAVYLACLLSSHIQAAGWTTWDANTVTANLTYAEYNSKYFNGLPVDISQRVSWSQQLSVTDSATYTFANMFGTWNPCAVATGICNPGPTDIAVSNFRGVKGATSSQFDWNISWPVTGIQYNLYRSVDNVSYTSVYTTVAANDTAVNFSYTDPVLPPGGSIYYYYVAASKAGYATHNTDTLQISSAPTIVVNASASLSLCGFSQAVGTPSASQTYTVSGTNLTGNLVITPPSNYEVSVNNTTWSTNAVPLNIVPVSGTVATTTVYIRLNAPVAGAYSGNIVNSSTGAASINVAVSGNAVPPPTSFLLQAWGLTANANDSVSVRSSGVTASTSTLNNLFTSDGSVASASIPGYSNQTGQALGANAAGNNWSNVGGTLKRGNYEEFTVTASAGNSVRIDSITFLSDFYLTTSGIKMGVVYSLNGFGSPADSTEFSNGIGPTGAALTTAVSGSFGKSFAILRNDPGPVDYYSLALNGTTGVTLAAGQKVSIRLYWACGSSGTPRFAFLKNVFIKGLVTTALPLRILSFNASLENGKVNLSWQTENEINTRGFDVERSADGVNFTPIGNVNAFNSAGIHKYALMDNSPLNGISFYRLKMIDITGAYKYSQVIPINMKTPDVLKLFPNPATDNISVTHKKAIAGARIEIYSTDGRKINQFAVNKDAMQTTISLASLPKGNYYLVFANGGEVQYNKFIKQ